ncbi:MAG TPA: alpha/beta hydrolase, partial [Acidimicrobiaceae bacterium]|nr:alpha/beta hydrolase [Acidimicrobiaceae bacterium]
MTLRASSSDGVELAIHDLGGDGPPLLFVHATGFHGRCYTRIAEQLGDIRHSWAPDLRAHGDSTIPADDRFHWSGMADDLCVVLDALGIDEPVDFVGHSMGGATVIATELRRPGTIRTAWLFEPIVFPPMGDNPSTMSDVARNRRASFDTIEAVLERYGSRPPFSVVDPSVLDDYVRHGFAPSPEGVTLKCTPESEARTFESVDYEVYGRLGG